MDRTTSTHTATAERDLLAALTHEIRSTLNGVVGMANLLQGTPLDDQQQSYVKSLRHCSDTLMVLANDVLDYAKLEAGQLQLESVAFDLHETLQATCRMFDFQASSKGLYLNVTGLNELPRWVNGDPTRIKQVITNLLGNAIKFTHNGGVELQCKATDLSQGWWLELGVADTGCGMSQTEQESLFKPYGQAHSAVARQHGGTGLGLWISQRLCSAMGGGLTIRSHPGQGSLFTACMQVQWANEADINKTDHHATPPPGWRVLVVDDEIFNREYLSAWMARLGIQVQAASSGEAALQQLEQGTFDMVLMDMHMPGLTGPQTAHLMRQVPHANPDLLIVGLSGTLDDETRSLYLQNGANFLLQKPIDWNALWRWVSEHRGASHAPRTTPSGRRDLLVHDTSPATPAAQ